MLDLKQKFLSKNLKLTRQNPLWSNDRGKLKESGIFSHLIISQSGFWIQGQRWVGIYLGVKTYKVFLCFVAIVRVRVDYVDFFVFFVLHHWWVSQVLTPRQNLVLLLKHFYSTHLWRSFNSFYIASQGLNNFPRKSQRKTVSWKSFRDYHWIFLCDLYASESLALYFEVLLVILLLHILDPANIYAWLVEKKIG